MEPEQEASAQLPELSSHDLTVEEATSLFVEAGVSRSPRTVRRYCAIGHLVCVKADTENSERYMINRNSVVNRIAELQSVVTTGHERTRQDVSGHDQLRPDMNKEETSQLEGEIDKLQTEIMQLTIDKSAKEQFINQMVVERREFIAQITDQSRVIGTLETRMLQLERPMAVQVNNPQPENADDAT